MDVNKLKFTNIANTAVMITDAMGYMRWANDSYGSVTGLHLPMWMNKDSGDISRNGYIHLHGDGGLMYKTVQKTEQSTTCTIDFPNAKNVITTAIPLQNEKKLDGIIYILAISEVMKKEIDKQPSGKIISSIKLDNYRHMVIAAPKMQEIYMKAVQLASFNTPIIVTGESGVGKDVFARFVHSSGVRSSGRFVHINCSALPEALFESEMFGYEAGAFTGAIKNGKAGFIEMADGGTLFLDEIAELPLSMQAKLLTFLSTGEFMKIGGSRICKADVRIIAATNREIKTLVLNKLFREDLYYRLSTIELSIPPLRERVVEIPLFIEHFLNKYNMKYGKEVELDGDTLELICSKPWHGNIRELSNVVERLVLFSRSKVVTPAHFNAQYSPMEPVEEIPLRIQMELHEKKLLSRTIKNSRTLQEAAQKLQIDLSTLTRKRQKYGI